MHWSELAALQTRPIVVIIIRNIILVALGAILLAPSSVKRRIEAIASAISQVGERPTMEIAASPSLVTSEENSDRSLFS